MLLKLLSFFIRQIIHLGKCTDLGGDPFGFSESMTSLIHLFRKTKQEKKRGARKIITLYHKKGNILKKI